MIHNKVDEKGNVRIRFGDLATLVANSSGLGSNPTFPGVVYLGHTEETEKLHGFFRGEGHIFAKLDRDNQISFYLADSLKMEYWSDGDDDPSYAVGINAWRTERFNLTRSERDYVYWVLNRRKEVKSVAA